ncbi:hypothetical protein GCM10025857_38440 [Alicyclobacillus contaminans]|uniref:hypothetical protein n=1 Tax=Alicyclobacillus contaminans TaxID=392016 RepID=UPI000417F8FA|nr:hypothetical protein [Alicyclobacillus contaminans]GMA52487.1 hypothetical protein GCM10025857_38440 [Alicyclobacillus contaminans]
MFKYYTGIAIMCVIFAVLSLFFSQHATRLAAIFLGMSGAFVAIAFVTGDPKSRW